MGSNHVKRGGIWTEAREKRLVQLWKLEMTASQIAAKLSDEFGFAITRNTVIGKRTRMGLPDRGNPDARRRSRLSTPRTPKAQKVKARAPSKPKIVYEPPTAKLRFPAEVIAENDVARKEIHELEALDCRWPVGDPREPGFGYCAQEAMPGVSWCRHHASRAFDLEKPLRMATREVRERRKELIG